MSSFSTGMTPGQGIIVLWTANDPDVARQMAFMYSENSLLNGWWSEVMLLIWGPSTKLLAGHAGLQEDVRNLLQGGVRMVVCKRCADNFGVSGTLAELGLEVFHAGAMLTDWIKQGGNVLTV